MRAFPGLLLLFVKWGYTMQVNAEIRDIERLNKGYIRLLTPLVIWFVITVGIPSVAFGLLTIWSKELENLLLVMGGLFFIIGVIAFIPIIIWLFIKAKRMYKETWITKPFDFVAHDGKIYFNHQKLHVNYNPSLNQIYVHDMGDYKNLYKATIYATINKPDLEPFLEYLQNNDVEIEKENLPRLPGKYGSLAPLGISKYRRQKE